MPLKRLTANVALWLMVLGIVSFIVIYAIFGQIAMIEISSGLLLGSLVMIFFSNLLAASYAVVSGSRDSGAVLTLGICSVGFFGAERQIWTAVYRYLDRPDWMLMHWSYPLIIWSCFWAVGVIMIAPGTEAGVVPTPNKLYLIVAAIIGSLVAGISIGMSLAQTTF